MVQPGMPVELWCSVSPNSTIVRWLLNGSVVSSQRPRGVELREGGLKIAAFNEPNNVSHEGVYQCLASSPHGTIMSSDARVEEAGKTPTIDLMHTVLSTVPKILQYHIMINNSVIPYSRGAQPVWAKGLSILFLVHSRDEENILS